MDLKFEDLPNAASRILEKLELIENLLLDKSDNPKPDSDKPLTLTEAAEFLGISKQTLYGFTSRNVIPYFKPGKRVYFLRKDLTNYIMEGRRKSYREIEIEAQNYLIQRKRRIK